MPLRPLARREPLGTVRGLEKKPPVAQLRQGAQAARLAEPWVGGGKGQLGGAAFEVARHNDLIVRIDHGPFRRAAEKVVGIADEILVKGVLPGHEDDRRFLLRAPHPAPPLESLQAAASCPEELQFLL